MICYGDPENLGEWLIFQFLGSKYHVKFLRWEYDQMAAVEGWWQEEEEEVEAC
jgi:hypothetical protein